MQSFAVRHFSRINLKRVRAAAAVSCLLFCEAVALARYLPFTETNRTAIAPNSFSELCTTRQDFGVVLCPAALDINGRVDENTPFSFQVINQGASAIKLNSIQIDSSFRVFFRSDSMVAVSDTLEVQLLYHPDKPLGRICEEIKVRFTPIAGGAPGQAVLPYCRTGLAPLIAAPQTLHFGKAGVKTSFRTKKLFISNPGTDSLHIKTIVQDPVGAGSFALSKRSYPWVILQYTTDSLEIRCQPEQEGMLQNEIEIESNAHKQPRIKVLLVGVGFNGPGMEFEPSAIQFDTCAGTRQYESVAVRNIGNDTLRIMSISSPNVAIWPPPPMPEPIPPERAVPMAFEFNPESAFDRNITYRVKSNLVQGDSLLAAHARSRLAGFRVAPTQALRDTLVAVIGETVAAPFYIDNAGDCPLFIDSIRVKPKTEPKLFDVSVSDSIKVEPRGQIAVWVKYKPIAETTDNAEIVVYAKYFDAPQSFAVVGNGLLGATLALDTTQIDFGKTCKGKSATREVRIRNLGHKSFTLDSISQTGSAAFDIQPMPSPQKPITIGSRGEHVFIVGFQPAVTGDDSAAFIFQTNAAIARSGRELRVRGHALAVELAADKSALHFSDTEVSGSAVDSIQFTNLAMRPIAIDTIRVEPTSAPFQVEPTSATLNSSQDKLTIKVRFEPIRPSTFEAKLIVESTADCADDTISLSGTGCAPELVGELNEIPFGAVDNCSKTTKDTIVTFKGCEGFILGSVALKYDTVFHVCAIEAAEYRLQIKLCFEPEGGLGLFTDVLTIQSNLYPYYNAWQIPVSATAMDLTAPTITDNTACKTLRPRESVTISATAADGCNPPPSLTLCYRAIGGKEHVLPFDNNGNAVIPGDSVTKRGIEYRIKAVDNASHETWEPKQGFRSLPVLVDKPGDLIWLGSQEKQQSYFPREAIENSYRLISVPLNLDEKKAERVIVDDLPENGNGSIWLLYDYLNGNYYEYTPDPQTKFREFIPGRAFWLITTQLPNELRVGPGSSVMTSPKSAARCNSPDYSRYVLEAGWNLVGNPFSFRITADSCTLNNGEPLNNIWQYDTLAGHSVADWTIPKVLEPWKGYAIHALRDKDILVFSSRPADRANAPGFSKEKINAANSGETWQIAVQARAGQHVDLDNYLGVREHALTGWDAADIFEPPPIGEYVAVYFPHRDWPDYPSDYAGDFRAPFAEGEVWLFEVKSNLQEKQISLTIKNAVSFPSHLSVYLYDKNRQALQNLRENASYTFDNLGELLPGRFELLIGTLDFVQHRTTAITNNLPDEIQLYQNFPNPFNQETIFSFYLPQAAPVTLKVFDVLGREVRVLSEGQVWEKGRQFVRWEGKDHSQAKVSSGVYVLSLKANNVIKQRRVLFIE